MPFIHLLGVFIAIGNLRSYYEYEIKREYDFLKLVCMLSITIYHTNFVRRVSFSSGQQPDGPTALGIWLALKSKIVLVLKSKAPYY